MSASTIFTFCTEDGKPASLQQLAAFSPQTISHLANMFGNELLFITSSDEESFRGVFPQSHLSTWEGTQEKLPSEGLLYRNSVIRENDLANASKLIKVKLHTDTDIGYERVVFPLPGSDWRETGRDLVWGNPEDKRPSNCSIITYEKNIVKTPAISVVISTYNQCQWLEKTLWGYEAQTNKDFEVIITDDGSRAETYYLISQIRNQVSYPIKHVWHRDDGFRKCDILNKGILASASDYLLFSDGDCIPRADFVETHIKLRERGRFLSNGYYKLSMPMSELITKDDILSGKCFNIEWLKKNGLPRTFKNNKFTAKGFTRWLLNTFTPTKATWNGHGSSGWLNDMLTINGYDERMQYGGQDREFGERLVNCGIKGKQIRYSTVCLHLDHARGYASQESISKNKALRKVTRTTGVKRSPYGIVHDKGL